VDDPPAIGLGPRLAAGEGPDTGNIAFVNWIYQLSKGNDSHQELFVAIAKRRRVDPKNGPVEKDHADQYRFVTVRVVSLPLPAPEQ